MIRTTRAALPLLRKATFARVVNVAASSIRHQSPGAHRLHRGEGRDGERVEEPLAGAGARGDHRQHGRAGHGDVADAGRRTSRAPTSPVCPKARSRPPTRPSPATTAPRTTSAGSGCRRRSRPWSCSSAPRSAASWWVPRSPLTAAPISSDRLLLIGFFRLTRADGVQPRRPLGAVADTIPEREAIVRGERRLTLRRDSRNAPTGSRTTSRRRASGPAITSPSTS